MVEYINSVKNSIIIVIDSILSCSLSTMTSVRYRAIPIILMLLYAIVHGNKCVIEKDNRIQYEGFGVDFPAETLKAHNSKCTKQEEIRTAACVTAIRSYCNDIGTCRKYQRFRLIGVSRTQCNDHIGISCIEASYNRKVSFAELQKYHEHCNEQRTQSGPCISASHRYCSAINQKYGGFPQELIKNDNGQTYLEIGCFTATYKDAITIDTLKKYNPLCNNHVKSIESYCLDAISSYCQDQRGSSGGVGQEHNPIEIVVACYDSVFHGLNVYVK